MANKPTAPASWDTNSTNLISVTSGHEDDGWDVDEVPSSSEMNGWMHNVGAWTEWLDTYFSTAYTDEVVTGTVDPLDPNGDGTLPYRVINLFPSANTTIEGLVAGFEGQELCLVNADWAGSYTVKIASVASTANQNIYIRSNSGISDLLMRPGSVVWLRYTKVTNSSHVDTDNPVWLVTHAWNCGVSTTLQIPASVATSASGSHTNGVNQWTLGNSTAGIYYPLTVPVGCMITGFSVKVKKQSDASNTITVDLYKANRVDDLGGAVGGVPTGTNNANAPGVVTVSPSSTVAYTTVDDAQYWIRVTQSDSSPSAVDSVGGVQVTAFINY